MKLELRKIFIATILVICIIAINIAIYVGVSKKENKTEFEVEEEEIIVDSAELTENFNNIFDNKLDYQNNVVNLSKEDNAKELVYTVNTNQEKVENKYELNVSIPYININNDMAKQINEEIDKVFYQKTTSILQNDTTSNTIYSVKYKAYVNDNILSLVISSKLKEGDNPQREIIKTYNYNLSSNSKLNITQILEYRKVSKNDAQIKINDTIKNASETANKYKELGYNKYLRDVNDDLYKLENTSVYFLGSNKALYILYPYGNSHYTSEVDIVVL